MSCFNMLICHMQLIRSSWCRIQTPSRPVNWRRLWHRLLPGFLRNLLESENLVCSATAGTKATLDIIQLWFNCFVTSFFKELGIHFVWEAMERIAPVASAFTSVALFVYGFNHGRRNVSKAEGGSKNVEGDGNL